MKCRLVPVTRENLLALATLAADPVFDIPRSVRWFRRLLFNDAIEEMRDNPVRGYMLQTENGEYVGMQCFYPVHIYLGQRRILAFSGAILGMKKRYAAWLGDLMDAVIGEEGNHLRFGNTSASDKAVAVSTSLCAAQIGPPQGEYAYMRLDMFFCVLALLRRTGIFSKSCLELLWKMTHPMRYIGAACKSFFAIRGAYRCKVYGGFRNEKFDDYWLRFLNSNKGVISGRESATLSHYFDESIAAGKVVLIAAEDDIGAIEGYVLLRKYRIYGLDSMIKYKIIDICAVNNNFECLKCLVKEAVRYSEWNNGGRVEYIGANPELEKWLIPYLNHKRALNHPTFTYYCPDNELELKNALRERRGWFFGPYDGERCLGHGEYIDL